MNFHHNQHNNIKPRNIQNDEGEKTLEINLRLFIV
jgi:hypothetical protein